MTACFLSINRALIKGMLDAPQEGHLEGCPEFKALGPEMTSESNQVFYLRTAGLLAKVHDLVSWGMSWMVGTG